jgi:protein phosphatase
MFIGTLLLIIGGRNNNVGESLPLDIYDTDTSDWYRLHNIERFRHSCFMIDHFIYIHGGFDQQMPNIPT